MDATSIRYQIGTLINLGIKLTTYLIFDINTKVDHYNNVLWIGDRD